MLLYKKRGRALAARKAPLITGHPATLQKEQIRPRSDAKADPAQLEQRLFHTRLCSNANCSNGSSDLHCFNRASLGH